MSARTTDRPYCLVLGGGGAKGVYQIGAWRALQELRIPVNAFIGNSIGAIVAAFLAQGEYKELQRIGESVGLDSILNVPPGLTMAKSPHAALPAAAALFRDFLDRGGLDTGPLRKLLESRIDEDRLRSSGVDLGVVTVNISDLKSREVFIENMERGHLVDYLMASSAFPGFESPKIEGKKYVDGGLHDNVPYAMARKRGYRRIIVVDISGMGLNRRPDIEGSETVYIRNSVDMGGTLNFDRSFLDSFSQLGYLDTLRTFGRLEGYSYFLEGDDAAERRYREHRGARAPAAELFPEPMRHDRRLLLKSLECAATVLALPRIRRYTYEGLAVAVEEKRVETKRRAEAALATSGPNAGALKVSALVKDALKAKKLDESPYFYHLLIEGAVSGRSRRVLESALGAFVPALAAAVAYFDAPYRS